MAKELGPHNIRVNCVNPTVIMTEMGKLGWSDPAIAKPMLDKIPLGRYNMLKKKFIYTNNSIFPQNTDIDFCHLFTELCDDF